MDPALTLFDQITATWFEQEIGTPTQVQKEAWPAIASGCDTLVSAPTGTGKTLSAFLVFIDEFKRLKREDKLKNELYLIYVSPLKSLAGDIRENLRRPLNGILRMERNLTENPISAPSDIQVAIRTGDTTQQERKSMIKSPPHILFTTPESLYLLLTSKNGKKMLSTARAIIIDELHALIDSKRGAHLMLSIARLDAMCPKPLQRIGLSATIEPLTLAASYLSPDPVTIVAPKMEKQVELKVTSPLAEGQIVMHSTIWVELAAMVYEHCKGSRSVIAFVDGRMYAEKLAYYVNQLGGDGYAKTHHGSLSKEQRLEVEKDLREGNLRLLCATSSMELGIDVGDVDQVFQVGCPRSISSTMQRLGRAGHNPGRVSVMHIFPRTSVEGLYCGITAQIVREGGIEHSNPPRLCLDVLAQHLVSMATDEGYQVSDVMDIVKRAYPFMEITAEDVRDVLCMLAGDYEHENDILVRPRVLYDRIHDTVQGDPYSRMLATYSGGTIPDKGMYSVKTDGNVKIGELDEEFVYEARIGDKFLLGTFAWKIEKIEKDSVIVSRTSMNGAQLPYWKGEIKGRNLKTGQSFGRILRELFEAYENDTLEAKLESLGLDERAADSAQGFLKRQIEVTHMLPDDKTIIIEHFTDDTGEHQMMVHSVFGRQVNTPLAILCQQLAQSKLDTNIMYVDDDDGFLLFPYGEMALPYGLLNQIDPATARMTLTAILPSTPMFQIIFRYNIAHALMMGVRKNGRQPLWIQRMRSAQMLDTIIPYKNHPILRETKRECLEQLWDLNGVELILQKIQSGDIKVYEINTKNPSPMSLPLRRDTQANMMSNYAPTPMGVHIASQEELKEIKMMTPSEEQLKNAVLRKKLPEDEQQLHSLLMMEGDLIAGELSVPVEWLESLAKKERVDYIEPGLWIAAEQKEEYENAFFHQDILARKHIVRRALRYRGAMDIEEIANRYLWTKEETFLIIEALSKEDSVVFFEGLYYHAMVFKQAQKETIKSRRGFNQTFPSSNYASLLVSRCQVIGTPKEQLEQTLKQLCNIRLSAETWESVILTARVKSYRPELLDSVLSQGEIFWRLYTNGELSFHRYEDIDWDCEHETAIELDQDETMIYEALCKRGATFMQGLTTVLSGKSPHDALMSLVGKGMVCADSFLPVRQWFNREKLKKQSIRQRVNVRVSALSNGRFEISHSVKMMNKEEVVNRLFDQMVVLCRETVHSISWQEALSVLRILEYTGQVRRGYFIEGMSGIQFIREKEFEGTILSLQNPTKEMVWIPALDPAQPYGKYLNHKEGCSFLNVVGTMIAIKAGQPIAILERQGKVLRVFEYEYLDDALQLFIENFMKKRVYPNGNRLVIKQYPKESETVLAKNRFLKEIQDYVLYRK